MGIFDKISRKFSNRRKTSRVIVNSLHSDCQNLTTGDKFSCFVMDVSKKGLACFTDGERLKPGDKVMLSIDNDTTLPALAGKVVVNEVLYPQRLRTHTLFN